MVEHMVMWVVVAPLLAAGAPVRLAFFALPRTGRRGSHVSALARGVDPHPSSGDRASVLRRSLVSHVPTIYDLTLRNDYAHEAEHGLYLFTAVLMWASMLGVDPLPHRPSTVGELICMAGCMLPMASIALWLGTAHDPVYAVHVGTSLSPRWRTNGWQRSSCSSVACQRRLRRHWRVSRCRAADRRPADLLEPGWSLYRPGMVKTGPGTDFPGGAAASLMAAVGCALVLVLTGCSRSSGTAAAAAPPSGSAYTLMQVNLCLSGLGGCYTKVQYPAAVEEAVARIREAHPDAVTVNEACGGDVALIARRTGYHPRFSSVIYYGKLLPCISPGGRGLFGDAVLTKAAIVSTDSHPFRAQAGPEQRQWLCVGTRASVEVCTAHLLPRDR